MNVEIPPELSPFVARMISLGTYRDENEMILDGLRLLESRERLRADVDAGIAQLDAGNRLHASDVFDRLEARARELDSSKAS